MANAALQLNLKDQIAFITFDDPTRKVNVLSSSIWTEFRALVQQVQQTPQLKGLIIQSGKANCFIVGADLNELKDADPRTPEPTRNYIEQGLNVLADLDALEIPTVALIDGYALGGGLEVALACDYRVVVKQSKSQLGLPEIRLALMPGWGGTQRLPRLIGCEDAAKMLLTGESILPDQLVDIPLASETVEQNELLNTALDIIHNDDWESIRAWRTDSADPDFLPKDSFENLVRDLFDSLEEDVRPIGQTMIYAMLKGLEYPLEEAIPYETEAFLSVCGLDPSRKRMQQFFEKRGS